MTISDNINIALASLTAIYVYLTYKLLRTATNTNETNKKLLSEQFRLSNFPILNLTTYTDNGASFLKIANIGNMPAYDMDIWIIINITDESITPDGYFKKYVREEHKKYVDLNEIKQNEDWFISDRGMYPVLTQKASIHVPLNYPPPDQWFFDVLVQYRDVLGNNYYQRHLFNSNHNPNQPYVADEIEPAIPTLIERINFTDENIDLNALNEGLKYIYQCYKSSFYADRLISGVRVGPSLKWRVDYE